MTQRDRRNGWKGPHAVKVFRHPIFDIIAFRVQGVEILVSDLAVQFYLYIPNQFKNGLNIYTITPQTN